MGVREGKLETVYFTYGYTTHVLDLYTSVHISVSANQYEYSGRHSFSLLFP